MIQSSKNKQITETSHKAEGELQEFHFSGGGEYEPLTIKARSLAEAEKLWREQRKKVEPSQIIN